jgi:HSP20 family protein
MALNSLISGIRHPLARQGDDPFAFMQRTLQRSLDDMWNGLPSTLTEAASMLVRLDVKEDEKNYSVTAELPGLSENEVEVTFDDGLLTIRGEKKVSRDDKKDTWHIIERSEGSFARQIPLPANVDIAKIEAKFDKGVLKVVLPKMPIEQTSAKKIDIKTGA